MPAVTTFLAEHIGDHRIEVVKIYDWQFAREAFRYMDTKARDHLWKSLEIIKKYDPAELPASGENAHEDFLWEELLEAAREDGNLLSFFVVNETGAGKSERVVSG